MRFNERGIKWLWLAVLIIVLDRLSKIWVVSHLTLFQPMPLLPIFNLTLAYNTGAAFSFLNSASGWQNVLFGGLAIIVSIVLMVAMFNTPAIQRLKNIAYALILAGALGNAWDRFLYGYVIDYFDFHIGTWHFAIFNVADSAVCIGALLLAFVWMREKSN